MIEMVSFVEQWLPITIDNVKPYYFVSNYGRIFSTYSNTFIEQQLTENGYLTVGLMANDGNRIHRKVHRLVMNFIIGYGILNGQLQKKMYSTLLIII